VAGVTLTETQPRKLRLLRVFRVIAATFQYCWKDARRLFVITWFACVLASASMVLLDWLVYSSPPLLPDWAQAAHFDPPTWLTPFFIAPWVAMGWAFVLNEMFQEDARRGTVKTPAREIGWLRFELSRTVLVAAAILAVVYLLEGASRWAHFQIVSAIAAAFDPSQLALTLWAGFFTAIRIALMIIVFTCCYPLAGLVLHTGTFSFAHVRHILRGNWLRVALIFLLLNIVLRAIDWLVAPATSWLLGTLTNSSAWSLQAGIARFVVDFPLQMLWIVAWAVTVGIVLHTLNPPPAAAERPGEGAGG
jgi:hypothetical protein